MPNVSAATPTTPVAAMKIAVFLRAGEAAGAGTGSAVVE
jgi:hypothetical protein